MLLHDVGIIIYLYVVWKDILLEGCLQVELAFIELVLFLVDVVEVGWGNGDVVGWLAHGKLW